MSRKFSSILGAALLVGALIASTIVPVSAAAANGTGPGSALAPDGQWLSLSDGQQVWYAFQYAGDDSAILVRMNVAPTAGASFAVWTPDQLQAWEKGLEVKAIGHGSESSDFGGDQIWSGHFNTAGTYYIIVDHNGSVPSDFSVSVSGSGVSYTAPVAEEATPVAAATKSAPAATPTTAAATATSVTLVATATPAPVAAATITTTAPIATATQAAAAATEAPVAEEAAPTGAGPEDALTINGDWKVLERGQQAWYAFSYGGGVQVTIRMKVTPNNGASFAVWTPSDLNQWITKGTVDPVGRGTANDSERGDLNWSGSFNQAGTYYVVVSQWNSDPASFQLTIE